MSDNNTNGNKNNKGPAAPTPSSELTKYNNSLPSDSLAENTLLQSQYIRFLENPDDYSDLSFSSTEAKFIRRKLTHLTTGAFAAIPLVCFERDSLVLMADLTVKPIQDVEIGDVVITHKGRPRKVIKTFCRNYDGHLMRFNTGRNSNSNIWSAWGTPNHEYWTREVEIGRAPTGTPSEEKAKQFQSPCPVCDMYIQLDGCNKNKMYTRHIKQFVDNGHLGLLRKQDRHISKNIDWRHSQDLKVRKSYLATPQITLDDRDITKQEEALAVVLGAYLAEGSVNFERRDKYGRLAGDGVHYTLHIEEEQFAQDIIAAWKTLGYKSREYFRPETSGRQIGVFGREPAAMMFRLGGRYSDQKRIHPEILAKPAKFLEIMLKYFMIGDGKTPTDDHLATSANITSQHLSWQFFMIGTALGLVMTPPYKVQGSNKGVKKRRKDIWIWCLDSVSSQKLLSNQIERPAPIKSFIDDKCIWRQITKIETKDFDGKVYNIEVEEDKSYIVNGYAVHNCRSSLCPFCDRCPFWQLDRAPEGRACLVETTLLKEWTIGFLKEYGVHPESMTDRIYVQELAEIELLLYRINSNLAKLQYGELVAESVNTVTPQGNVIYEEKVVPLMDLKLRLQGRRDRVVKLMVGDRQEKYKKQAALKQSDKEDASTQGSSLKQKLDQLQRQVAIVGAKIADSPDGMLTEASNDKVGQGKQQEPREKLDNQLEEVVDIEENSARPSAAAETPQNNKENELSEEIVDEPYASSNVIDIFLDDEDNGEGDGEGSSGE